MNHNVYDILLERGFVYQCTDETVAREHLAEPGKAFYIGYDPTADSFHVGSMVPILAMVHLQRAGHKPIALLGSGTCMVGDPSGRTEMRQLLSCERIGENAVGLRAQLERFLDFSDGRAVLLNNAEWLMPINYIEFLREIGRHFSINRMLTAESVKQRLETGLSFLEFNYPLLQAYDFYVLARDRQCLLQMGGQDQWGNIVAGVELVRKKLNAAALGITFPLLMNSSGQKFGKSAAGNVWLDAARTPVFDFYQFWRNVEDTDVRKLLGLFTFLPMDEVARLSALQPPLLNRAKEILAWEVTRMVHGRENADASYFSAVRQFGCSDPDGAVETSSEIPRAGDAGLDTLPSTPVERARLEAGLDLCAVLVEAGLAASRAEVRRLVQQGGLTVGGRRIDALPAVLGVADFAEGPVLVKIGKKRFHRLTPA